MSEVEVNSVLNFWFEELDAKQHWVKDVALDQEIARRFGALHAQAVADALSDWRVSAKGRLAEIIVLDQFSRNMFRDQPAAFAQDVKAVALTLDAISVKADQSLGVEMRSFMYMPLMHSESLEHHDLAMKLFDQPGLENNLDFERQHRRIIERFGRYPHRNQTLGRVSTPEELEFLAQPGSSF